eukprot:10193816-Prorocentrum_lima.AAC.1
MRHVLTFAVPTKKSGPSRVCSAWRADAGVACPPVPAWPWQVPSEGGAWPGPSWTSGCCLRP